MTQPAHTAPAQSPSRPGAIVLCFLLLSSAISYIASRGEVRPMDFYQMWFVTQFDAHNVESPYSRANQAMLSRVADERISLNGIEPLEQATLESTKTVFAIIGDGRMIQSTGTPLLYATTDLFATDSFDVSANVAQAVLVLCYVIALFMTARMMNLTSLSVIISWTVIWTALVPACFDLYFVNVSGIQMLLLVSLAWLAGTKRFFAAGLVAAYAGLLKPTAAYPVVALTVFIAAQGDWKATARYCVGGLSGGGVALGVTYFAFGSISVWSDWVTLMLPQIAETNYGLFVGNDCLNALIYELFDIRMTGLLTAVTLIPAAALCAYRGWEDRRLAHADSHANPPSNPFAGPFWSITAGTCAMLLSTPLAWMHYYVLLLPALMVLACRPGVPNKIFGVMAVAAMSRLLFVQPPADWNYEAIREIAIAVGYIYATLTIAITCVIELASGLDESLARVRQAVIDRFSRQRREMAC